jgi:proteasome beta subunit
LRTAWQEGLATDQAVAVAVGALVAAAQEDTATGGPDLRRGILPNVLVVGPEGVNELSDDEVRPAAEAAVESIR